MAFIRSIRTLLLAACAGVLTSPANAKVTVKELFYILERDGLSNSLQPETSIFSLGRILLQNRWYSLFYYDHVAPATKHGLRRILVLNDRKRYIGGYNVEESENCRLNSPKQICYNSWERRKQVTLDFSNGRLPRYVTIDGMDVTFEK